MKIAIDGPSASGKGTIAKLLAEKLSLTYLNTGKIYRIVANEASKMNGDVLTNALHVSGHFSEYWELEHVPSEIYSSENGMRTSKLSQNSQIRHNLMQFQLDFIQNNGNIILEGRDIGTVVMPNADFKFYIDASAEERAKRRVQQLGGDADYNQILMDLKTRDENDKSRTISALKIADDAVYIDTTNLSIDAVMDVILRLVLGK